MPGADLLIEARGHSTVEVPGGSFLLGAEFLRSGPDLVLVGQDGTRIVVRDYFSGNAEPPTLVTPSGAHVDGATVETLVGPQAPGQVAQSDADVAPGDPIGRVDSVEGAVTVVRSDGSPMVLAKGDFLYPGDAIETGPNGTVGMTFADDTAFSLARDGRMTLDDLIYDPSGSEHGSLTVSVLQGMFSFVGGEIAKSGPDGMTINTPAATIGIHDAGGNGHIGPDGRGTFAVMEDIDPRTGARSVGEMVITNDAGTMVLNRAFLATWVDSFDTAPSSGFTMAPRDFGREFGAAIQGLPHAREVLPAGFRNGVQEGYRSSHGQYRQDQEREIIGEGDVSDDLRDGRSIFDRGPLAAFGEQPLGPVEGGRFVPPPPPMFGRDYTRLGHGFMTIAEPTPYDDLDHDLTMPASLLGPAAKGNLFFDRTVRLSYRDDPSGRGAVEDFDDVFLGTTAPDTLIGRGLDTNFLFRRSAFPNDSGSGADTIANPPGGGRGQASFTDLDNVRITVTADATAPDKGTIVYHTNVDGGSGVDTTIEYSGVQRFLFTDTQPGALASGFQDIAAPTGDTATPPSLHGDVVRLPTLAPGEIVTVAAGTDAAETHTVGDAHSVVLAGGGGDTMKVVAEGKHFLVGGHGTLDNLDDGSTAGGTAGDGIPDAHVNTLDYAGLATATGWGAQGIEATLYTSSGEDPGKGGGDVFVRDRATGGGHLNDMAWDVGSFVATEAGDLLHITQSRVTSVAGGFATVDAGAGDDVVSVRGEALMVGSLRGGAGTDTLNFVDATAAVGVDLKSGAVTGPLGTGAATGFENVVGGAGNDTLVGDDQANVLTGGRGADTLTGGGGGDTFQFGNGVGMTPAERVASLALDVIEDFKQGEGDKFVLSNETFGLGVTGNPIYLETVSPLDGQPQNLGTGAAIVVVGSTSGQNGVDVYYTDDASHASNANSYQIGRVQGINLSQIDGGDFSLTGN